MAMRFLLTVSALVLSFGAAERSTASLDAPAHLSRDALEEVGFDWSAQGLRLYANRPTGSAYAQPRHLQATTCSASTANGVWSGQPPQLNTQRCVPAWRSCTLCPARLSMSVRLPVDRVAHRSSPVQ
jgi:hypothetical protein